MSNKKKSLQQVNLKGRVKKVELTERDAVKADLEFYPTRIVGKDCQGYDKNGNIQYDISCGVPGQFDDYDCGWSYEYDDKGNEITAKYNEEGTNHRTVITIYDECGNIKEKKSEGKITSYKCDDGKVIESNEFDYEGSLEEKTIYAYDDSQLFYRKDNLLETNKYDNENNLIEKSYYNYDDNGQKIEHITLNGFGELLFKKTISYHDNGNEKAVLTGNYQNGELRRKSITKCLEYDMEGNWIKKLKTSQRNDHINEHSINEEHSTFLLRKIEYFENDQNNGKSSSKITE